MEGLEKQSRDWRDESGKTIPIPAIDARWVEKAAEFPPYFKAFQVNQVEEEAWRASADELSQSFAWLLRLSYHKFWSQVIFDAELGIGLFEGLDSFLRNTPRVTDPELFQWMKNAGHLELQRQLYTSVFAILVRLSTSRVEKSAEQPGNFLGEEYHAQLLGRLFPITRLMDISAVFLPGNEVAKKMVASILAKRKEYARELSSMLELMGQLLERCLGSVRLWRSESIGSGGSAETQRNRIVGAVAYAVDAVHSLSSLAAAAPVRSRVHILPILLPTKASARSTQPTLYVFLGFVEQLYSIAWAALPTIMAGPKAVWHKVGSLRGRLSWLLSAAASLLRLALSGLFLRLIADASASERKKADARSGFVSTLRHVLSAFPCLGLAYLLAYPLEDEKEVVGSAELATVAEECRTAGGLRAEAELRQMELLRVAEPESLSPEQSSVVDSLAEMFPDHSRIFLAVVGHQYGWAFETALDALLSSSLPQTLAHYRLIATKNRAELDGRREKEAAPSFSLAHQPPPPSPPMAVAELASGPTAFDPPDPVSDLGDGLTRLKVGKKHGGGNWSHADRNEVTEMREFYASRAIETPADGEDEGLYDDEYDDTYDAIDRGGANEPVEDFRARPKPFATAYAFGDMEPGSDEEEDSENLPGVPANRNRNYAASSSRPPPPGPSHSQQSQPRANRGSYTGGTQRLRKEQHSAHNKANRARAKYSKGMF